MLLEKHYPKTATETTYTLNIETLKVGTYLIKVGASTELKPHMLMVRK